MRVDEIIIEALELRCHLGITEEERAVAQRVTATITLTPRGNFAELGDDIRKAVDYFQVSRDVQHLAAARPRNLIETLAIDVANELLAKFDIAAVELHLRKFVMPDTASTGVRLRLERAGGPGSQE